MEVRERGHNLGVKTVDFLAKAEKLLNEQVRPYAWPLVFIAFLCFMALGPFAFNVLLSGDE